MSAKASDGDRLRIEAVARYALFCSGSATEQERADIARWRQERPEHEAAWQRLAGMRVALDGLPRSIAGPTLRAVSQRRRTVLKSLLAGGGAGLGWAAWHEAPWRPWLADHRSATGGFSRLVLDDGTELELDSATAVNVRFDDARRVIELLAGQIYVATAVDPRPFFVQSADGLARPLGTRFTVRQLDAGARVAVYQGAVELAPRQGGQRSVVPAGRQAVFTARDVGTMMPADQSALGWREGLLTVVDLPLADFCAELARYRPGYLTCDPALGALRVSGTYPLGDTDRALQALARAFPLRIHTLTRFWTRVEVR